MGKELVKEWGNEGNGKVRDKNKKTLGKKVKENTKKRRETQKDEKTKNGKKKKKEEN